MLSGLPFLRYNYRDVFIQYITPNIVSIMFLQVGTCLYILYICHSTYSQKLRRGDHWYLGSLSFSLCSLLVSLSISCLSAWNFRASRVLLYRLLHVTSQRLCDTLVALQLVIVVLLLILVITLICTYDHENKRHEQGRKSYPNDNPRGLKLNKRKRGESRQLSEVLELNNFLNTPDYVNRLASDSAGHHIITANPVMLGGRAERANPLQIFLPRVSALVEKRGALHIVEQQAINSGSNFLLGYKEMRQGWYTELSDKQ